MRKRLGSGRDKRRGSKSGQGEGNKNKCENDTTKGKENEQPNKTKTKTTDNETASMYMFSIMFAVGGLIQWDKKRAAVRWFAERAPYRRLRVQVPNTTRQQTKNV